MSRDNECTTELRISVIIRPFHSKARVTADVELTPCDKRVYDDLSNVAAADWASRLAIAVNDFIRRYADAHPNILTISSNGTDVTDEKPATGVESTS